MLWAVWICFYIVVLCLFVVGYFVSVVLIISGLLALRFGLVGYLRFILLEIFVVIA